MRRSGIGSLESPLLESSTSSSAITVKPSPREGRYCRSALTVRPMLVLGRVTKKASAA